jgi:hypothetical protein
MLWTIYLKLRSGVFMATTSLPDSWGFGGTDNTAEPSPVHRSHVWPLWLLNNTSIETVYFLHEQFYLSRPGEWANNWGNNVTVFNEQLRRKLI